ncbi:hypothetical protein QTP70_007969 [Hemibagrus guttatus]|uniref:Dopamine beta-hydroxylase n=1 Tax=Hemibagrus guttatus TaxID=175788 RepID=A0AAE0QHW1_9TELE|nr:hypothetical protein QTP70_007969 [Hemibagrus guttatus]
MDRISRRSQGLEGVRFGDHRISSLIFAGDVVLLASSSLDLQHALGRFAAECEATGMRVSTSKSEAMVLDRKKVACTLQVGGEVLPQVEKFKYLGVLFTSEGRMDREIDRRIGAAAAVMRSMYRSVVVKKELSRKAKLSIYQSIYVPTLTYGHELWVMTERVRSRIQAAEMSFLHRVVGPSLRDSVSSSVTREELGVEPLLLHIERGQLRWLGHLFRMPPGRLPGEVFQACPTGKRPRGRPRTRWRDSVSRLAWERLRVPPEELEEVSGEREYEAVVSEGNEAIVHHMEVFECSPHMDSVPQYSGFCDSKMKPPKLNSCRHVLAAWALGAEPFYYPSDAGLPLGGEGSSRFLRLEVHYHNPLHISGRRDSSGIRLWFTSSLRRFDAGIMELGLVYTPVMAIPPHQHTFQLTGYCTAECTRTALPPGGIHIFASQLHTHLAGRGVRTVLVRGGREVEVVQEDKHFSAHYQGDVLLTKCTYNTEDRVTATVGGFGIMEEMCVNYVHYYPRTQLELCKSHVDLDYLQRYFSIINRFHGGESCSCSQTTVEDQFSSVTWDSFSAEVLDSLYTTSPISMHCNQSTAELFPGSMYIEKSRGPKTEPCGTPYFTGITLDSSPFKSTNWYRSDRMRVKQIHDERESAIQDERDRFRIGETN